MAISKRSGRMKPVEFPDAIAAGSVQCPPMYTKRRGAPLSSSEGALVFYQDRVVFFADDGEDWRCDYSRIRGYEVRRRGLVLRRLTLHSTDGSTIWFKVSRQMAKNASHILAMKVGDS